MLASRLMARMSILAALGRLAFHATGSTAYAKLSRQEGGPGGTGFNTR